MQVFACKYICKHLLAQIYFKDGGVAGVPAFLSAIAGVLEKKHAIASVFSFPP
jgi:hypothetical protein